MDYLALSNENHLQMRLLFSPSNSILDYFTCCFGTHSTMLKNCKVLLSWATVFCVCVFCFGFWNFIKIIFQQVKKTHSQLLRNLSKMCLIKLLNTLSSPSDIRLFSWMYWAAQYIHLNIQYIYLNVQSYKVWKFLFFFFLKKVFSLG